MKIKELKDIIRSLPDDKEIILFNDCSEWYGVESIPLEAIKVIDNNLVINFNLEWDKEDIEEFKLSFHFT